MTTAGSCLKVEGYLPHRYLATLPTVYCDKIKYLGKKALLQDMTVTDVRRCQCGRDAGGRASHPKVSKAGFRADRADSSTGKS